ncbi:hypothetical protein [Paenibacillus lentus]|uniref:Uncharacterized protein n=1 Tax=Paenibacillus lentus TaxID=1338368 RepID=A0A3S8RPK3_9BACL|nr:hypothetical protein [Paenibacillus lentus]AZK44965.1 hypothetical protein EIM92_01120 [Paenibacillus lentus]
MKEKNEYEEVMNALSMNREIEFSYKNVTYALVYHQKGWCLVNRKEKLSLYYQDNNELLENIRLDNKTFFDLLKEGSIKIETIF